MLIYHLFSFSNKKIGSYYISIIGIKIEYIIEIFGKICVSMFLFLSGYGMYIVINKNKQFTILNAMKNI